MSKGFKKYFPYWLLITIAFSVIAFVIPIERDKLFYTLFCFALGTHLVQLIISFFAFNNEENELKYPVFYFSRYGLILILVVNAIVLYKYPLFEQTWVFVVVDILILLFHYLFLILLNVSLHKNVERDEHVREKTNTVINYVNEVKTLADNTNNEDIYKLYEALKYTNKASKESTKSVEKEIEFEIEKLKNLNDEKEIKEKVKTIIELINKRNNL